MSPTGRSELYGLLGHPVAHSLSPALHGAWFRAEGRDAVYLAFDVLPARLEAAFHGLAPLGFRGLNVTTPHKAAVLALVDRASEDARVAGGANCLRRDGEGWIGENTDGEGFCLDVEERLGLSLAGRRLVVLGAGAAARSVVSAAIRRNPGRVTVVNRSEGRLDGLPWPADRIERLLVGRRDRLAERLAEADLVVHATSWGLAGKGEGDSPWPLRSIRSEALATDLNYDREGSTLFLSRIAHVRRTSDGLGMLIRQALLSQEHWTGRRPKLEVLVDELEGRADAVGAPCHR